MFSALLEGYSCFDARPGRLGGASYRQLEVARSAFSPTAAYGTAVAFNLGNPTSPIVLVALLSPIVALSGSSPAQAALLLIGMFAAVTAWWICLAGSVSLLRSRLTPRMLVAANQIAG